MFYAIETFLLPGTL